MQGERTGCPICEEDPESSQFGLQRVDIVGEDELAAGAEDDSHHLTPIAEVATCPLCTKKVPLDSFQVESLGEVWEGDAAVWAEEGVCGGCYRNVLPPFVRDWTDREWLFHHFEGWKATLADVHDLVVYTESPQEGWMLGENKHKILDVEGTLTSRREHLARCQMACKELLEKYGKAQAPPPFQETLEVGAESVSARSVAELKKMREGDLSVEMKLREESRLVYKAQVSESFADLKAKWHAAESHGDLDVVVAPGSPNDGSGPPGPTAPHTPGGEHSRSFGGHLLVVLMVTAALLGLAIFILSSRG